MIHFAECIFVKINFKTNTHRITQNKTTTKQKTIHFEIYDRMNNDLFQSTPA